MPFKLRTVSRALLAVSMMTSACGSDPAGGSDGGTADAAAPRSDAGSSRDDAGRIETDAGSRTDAGSDGAMPDAALMGDATVADATLADAATTLDAGSSCGNGVLDDGEECDPGIDATHCDDRCSGEALCRVDTDCASLSCAGGDCTACEPEELACVDTLRIERKSV